MELFACTKHKVDMAFSKSPPGGIGLRQLEQTKRYLKIGYRIHCETFSNCDTHCISFALSNTKPESLQIEHNHLHNETCHQCALLMSTNEAIRNLVKMKEMSCFMT